MAHLGPAPSRRRRLALGATVALTFVSGAVAVAPASAEAPPRRPQDIPVPPTPSDPALVRDLDVVVGASPDDTCLRVEVDGIEVYDHRGDDPQAPASTQKLLTAAAVLDGLGADRRLPTTLVGPTPSEGSIAGDVTLVGGGDPTLTTSVYRILRQVPSDRPVTLLDEIADQLEAAGVRRIEGRILADGSRHDDLQVVPSWPRRFVAQDVVGPLGALAVDAGHVLVPAEGGGTVRVRSDVPPVDAARALTAILRSRGIVVVGDPVAGRAPAGAPTLASLASPPVGEIVADLLLRSDNREAEVLLKELAATEGDGGTTAAGAAAVARWTVAAGADAEGARVVDGSGLDPTNLVTCRQLLRVLDASGGRTGAVAAGLPVAGETGTLAARFTTTSAAGRLRAKTGSLDGVTSLAGYVDLPDGGVAAFSFIANASAIDPGVRRAQDILAEVLASYRPPCPGGPRPGIVAPNTAGTLAAATSSALGAAGAVTAAPVLLVQRRGSLLIDRCSAAAGVEVLLGG